jgi:AcrR family transcriptional regulator
MLNTVKTLPTRAVEAAFVICRDQGTEAVSMRKVGRALSVSGPALYHHFVDKQELLAGVADHGFQLFELRLRKMKARDPERRIRELVHTYRDFAADHRRLFNLMFVEPRASARRFPTDFAEGKSSVFNLLRTTVDELLVARRRSSGPSSLELAQNIWALLHGQTMLWLAGRFDDDATFRRVLDRSIARSIKAI